MVPFSAGLVAAILPTPWADPGTPAVSRVRVSTRRDRTSDAAALIKIKIGRSLPLDRGSDCRQIMLAWVDGEKIAWALRASTSVLHESSD